MLCSLTIESRNASLIIRGCAAIAAIAGGIASRKTNPRRRSMTKNGAPRTAGSSHKRNTCGASG